MGRVERAIEALLAMKPRPSGFRNQDLADALGVSRGRASQLLAERVRSGELTREGDGYGPYVPGPDAANTPDGLARGALPRGFWRAMSEAVPTLAYVRLRGLGLVEVRTRQQARAALRDVGFPRQFLIVDFEGIALVSSAACDELVYGMERRAGMYVEAINMEPAVARTFRLLPKDQGT